ncbi:MAG: hypothetical protein ACRDPJ_07360 [Nocardioidaceae bacterium]
MPKRWRVLYSGGVYAELASNESRVFQEDGGLGADYTDVVADVLEVVAGSLVFTKNGAVEYVFAPGSYWFVVQLGQA